MITEKDLKDRFLGVDDESFVPNSPVPSKKRLKHAFQDFFETKELFPENVKNDQPQTLSSENQEVKKGDEDSLNMKMKKKKIRFRSTQIEKQDVSIKKKKKSHQKSSRKKKNRRRSRPISVSSLASLYNRFVNDHKDEEAKLISQQKKLEDGLKQRDFRKHKELVEDTKYYSSLIKKLEKENEEWKRRNQEQVKTIIILKENILKKESSVESPIEKINDFWQHFNENKKKSEKDFEPKFHKRFRCMNTKKKKKKEELEIPRIQVNGVDVDDYSQRKRGFSGDNGDWDRKKEKKNKQFPFRTFRKKEEKEHSHQSKKEINPKIRMCSLGDYSEFWNIIDLHNVLYDLRRKLRHFFEGRIRTSRKNASFRIDEVKYFRIVKLPSYPEGNVGILDKPKIGKMYVSSKLPGCSRVFASSLRNQAKPFNRHVVVKYFLISNKKVAKSVLEELNHGLALSYSGLVANVIGYTLEFSKIPVLGIVMERMDCDVSNFIRDYKNIQKIHPLLPKYPLLNKHKFLVMNKIVKCCLFLHENGVVHRDIKAKNFLIRIKDRRQQKDNYKKRSDFYLPLDRKNFVIKLADFGISKKVGKEGVHISSSTFYGKGKGTKYWLAPELIINSIRTKHSDLNALVYSFQTDIYALGITFWEILTESIPYVNELDSEDVYAEKKLFRSIVKGKRPKMKGMIENKRFKKLIRKCWDGNTSKRFQNISEIDYWFEKNEKYFL